MSSLFSLFSEIHPGRTTWAIKARVIRLYKLPLFKRPEEIGSFEMVLHDSTGERIHASMKVNIMNNLGRNITEGSIYRIKNFVVVENKNTFKTTTNRYKLVFYRATHMNEYEDSEFPFLMHNFKEFHELSADKEIDEYQLIDVMGRVVSYQLPNNVFGMSSKRMDFRIEDTDGRQLSCSLWAEYIDDLLPVLLENTKEKPVVIAMLFAKVSRFRDEIKVSNTYHVTKIIVNGEGDCFINFTNRLGMKDNVICNKVLSNSNYEIYDEFAKGRARVRTLAYLNELHDDGLYWVEATIVDIQTTKDCWYLACKKCARKRVLEETTRKCIYCDEQNLCDIYRYKLEVMAVDYTGSATLIMWNKPCVNLIGKCAAEIKEIHGDSTGSIPSTIEEALINKKSLFEVRIQSNKNITQGDYYTVSRVAFDEEIMDVYAKNYTGNQEYSTNDHDNTTHKIFDDARNEKGKEKCSEDGDNEVVQIRTETENNEVKETGAATEGGMYATDNLKRKRIKIKKEN